MPPSLCFLPNLGVEKQALEPSGDGGLSKWGTCLPLEGRSRGLGTPRRCRGNRWNGSVHGTWIFRGLQGRRLSLSSSPPHSSSFFLPALLPPDQLYISVQHCQDLNDKVTSIHHIRDNPVQVSDGSLDPQQGRNEEAIWAIPLPLGRTLRVSPGGLTQAPRRNTSQ